jgi:hypothetical protein
MYMSRPKSHLPKSHRLIWAWSEVGLGAWSSVGVGLGARLGLGLRVRSSLGLEAGVGFGAIQVHVHLQVAHIAGRLRTHFVCGGGHSGASNERRPSPGVMRA